MVPAYDPLPLDYQRQREIEQQLTRGEELPVHAGWTLLREIGRLRGELHAAMQAAYYLRHEPPHA